MCIRDRRVDADELALVIHQRAAGIAGVDGRIEGDLLRVGCVSRVSVGRAGRISISSPRRGKRCV